MMKATREFLFAVLSFALGGWAFYKTQQVAGPGMEDILADCTSSHAASTIAESNSLHPFEPKLGLIIFAPFVCLLTQFIYELTQNPPAGLLVWFGLVAAVQPVSVLVTVEAGRSGTRGPIRYPTILFLLFQLFGISVVFPTVWIPAYYFGRGDQGVPVARSNLAVPLAIPGLILSILVFWLDPNSYTWQVCSGIVGGPILALMPALLWGLSPPDRSSQDLMERGSRATRRAYQNAAVIATGIWWFILYVVWSSYYGYGRGGRFADATCSLWKDIWMEANPAVAFMAIDCLVLWASMLLFLAFYDIPNSVTVLMLTPVLGPGAPCCLIMAEMESERALSTGKAKQQ